MFELAKLYYTNWRVESASKTSLGIMIAKVDVCLQNSSSHKYHTSIDHVFQGTYCPWVGGAKA